MRKVRKPPKAAYQALESLMECRDDPLFAEGQAVAVDEAASAAFEAEVAMQALAGKGSLPRRVRAELHQVAEARRERAMSYMPSLADLGVAEVV